ncbi:MAG: S8 family peptidase [Candidatus Tectomicrobia bacterium]|uniref:S8 family peptidase n=1 Tax=Tectimicrobiota bacterium TaxID=2528274 RepID=A0A932CLB8_UNCTE|nr:S8 family peptidase [Candidatus Tectomicrobia bacterium]
MPPERVGLLARDRRVALIEPDLVVVAFPSTGNPAGGSVGVSQSLQTLPTGVNRIEADQNPNLGTGIKVAIIDTGIDTKHPDLSVAGGISFASGRSSNFNDGNGHGTHVAGIVAALDNAIGVVGMAPGVKLYAVRVLDSSGSGTLSRVIKGLDWAANNRMQVANMSLGGAGYSSAMCSSIANAVGKGVTVVVAAGNSASDASGFTPANCLEAITVSAMADSNGISGGGGPMTPYGADDTFATFSNFGSNVDIAAPGVNIYSTYKDQRYATLSGTSMATPHVSGAAALYIATYKANHGGAFPSVAEVVNALMTNAWLQSAPEGFTGDSDGSAEPLVNAGGL